jgi:hypothetical protein
LKERKKPQTKLTAQATAYLSVGQDSGVSSPSVQE